MQIDCQIKITQLFCCTAVSWIMVL